MEGQREGESRLRGYFGLYFSMFHHAVFKHLMFGLLNILIFLLTKPFLGPDFFHENPGPKRLNISSCGEFLPAKRQKLAPAKPQLILLHCV